MVSQHEGTFFPRKRDFTIFGEQEEEEFHNSFKKSKQEDPSQGTKLQSTFFNERPNQESVRSFTFDFELHLHKPLPSYWQPKEYKRKFEDHRTYHKDPKMVGPPNMSLDLELNLSPSYSPSKTATNSSTNSITGTGLNRSLSGLAFQGDDDDGDDKEEQEMVAKVCMKCHMLVMLCTLTPVCPNCKFMHPHDHSSRKMFKPSNLLSLLC